MDIAPWQIYFTVIISHVQQSAADRDVTGYRSPEDSDHHTTDSRDIARSESTQCQL